MRSLLVMAGFAAICAGAAMAQEPPMLGDAPEFGIERRDALRRIWQGDPAIRDFVGPGDAERLDAPPALDAGQARGRPPLGAAVVAAGPRAWR